MRLELASYEVKDVAFGKKTEVVNGTLVINRQELRETLLVEPQFKDVEIDIARPGESTRVVHALDVLEPRFKVEGQGQVFPGIVGPPLTVGAGRTNRLAGVAVIGAGEPVPGEPVHWREAVIDMSGPGAEMCPFGRTLNITLNFKPDLAQFPTTEQESKDRVQGGARVREYNWALTRAQCQAAAYIGQASAGKRPDQVEALASTPADQGLMRVAAIYQTGRPAYYGAFVSMSAATLLHPNESFDGALVNAFGGPASSRQATYFEQNNEVLMELSRRHGKEINFVGYILFGGNSPAIEEKERNSSAASRLARLVQAQAAVIMGQSQSNAAVDCMWTLQKCERAGIKTSLIYMDAGLGADDPGFVFFVPEADAIVCTGTRDQPVTLPPVKKVIGGSRLLEMDNDSSGELNLTARYLYGVHNLLALNRLRTRFV